MKPNMFLTIILGVLTLAFTVFSILRFKDLEKLKWQLEGRPPMDGKPAIKSIEEEELAPKRLELEKIMNQRDQVKVLYYEKHREMVTNQHKSFLSTLSRSQAIYYTGKWKEESVLFTEARKGTEESKKKEIESYQAQIDGLNSVIARDTLAYDEKKNIIRTQKQELTDRVPLVEDNINREKNYKETQIARSREELKKYVLKSASTYTFPTQVSSILASDPVLKVVVIDIGKKDGVKRGMRFDIFQEDAMQNTFVKGQVRINDVTDTTATGYVIDLSSDVHPVIVGDKIGNPLYIRFKDVLVTGEIIESTGSRNEVIVSLGKSHGTLEGMVFDVYKESRGTNRVIKSKCKITEVSENSSKALLFDITEKNIFPGDIVGTPIENEKVKTFYLAGSFRKKYSKEAIADKIRKFGHAVVDQLTPTITYVVTGTEEAEEDTTTARELNITVMTEDSILRYLD